MNAAPDNRESRERFLKLAEVQAMLGVSRCTVWRWTAEQGLKVVRVGAVTRIRERDLQAFLRRHETGAGNGQPSASLADNGETVENGA